MDDWSFCTTVPEAISLLHAALTNYDYMRASPRLDLISNPYNRQLLPLSFYTQLLDKIKQLSRREQSKIIKKYPAVVVFLKNMHKRTREFEPKRWEKKSVVQRSNILYTFLSNEEIEVGSMKYKINGVNNFAQITDCP